MMKIIISLLVAVILSVNQLTVQAGNIMVNIRKNVINRQTDNSAINSGIDLGSDNNSIQGNGVQGSKIVKLPVFTQLELAGAFKVKIICKKNGNNTMKIIGDTNLITLVETQLNKDQLNVSLSKSYSTKEPIKLELNINNFNQIKATGANIIIIDKLNTKNFTLTTVNANKITMSGQVTTLRIDAKDASNVQAGKLICQNVNLHASGAVRISVNATQVLTINAKDVAKVYYSGKPKKIIKHISGAAELIHKNSLTKLNQNGAKQ